MNFLEYFKFLREKYEVSNTELLNELTISGSEIKKSSLSHKLNGERKITIEELEIFILVLQPSVAEESKLRELYKIYDFGEVEFEEVKLIKEYIEQFENNVILQLEESDIDLNNVFEINDEKFLTTVLLKILSDSWGNGNIEIMCQPEYTRLIDLLLSLSAKKHSEVKQIVFLNNEYKNDSNIYNIRCLTILDKLVIKNPMHKIRYFYDKVNARINELTIFPFFVLSGDKALLISHNFKTGYLIHDKLFINKLSREFNRIFNQANELFRIIANDIEYMQICSEFEKSAKNMYTLQYHPCIRFNGDENLTKSCIRDDFDFGEELLEFFQSSWENQGRFKGYHFHSSAGVQDFLEKGITTDMSPMLFNSVEKQNRELMLKKAKENKVQSNIEINDKFINVPLPLSIVCYDTAVVLISYRNNEGTRLLLNERSLYKSTINFFNYIYKYERVEEGK
ncbi:MAG: hypothetical protein E7510_05955 [Ruminococcus sp.]|nr:hypothetical protein [Ruminococcus sp.]